MCNKYAIPYKLNYLRYNLINGLSIFYHIICYMSNLHYFLWNWLFRIYKCFKCINNLSVFYFNNSHFCYFFSKVRNTGSFQVQYAISRINFLLFRIKYSRIFIRYKIALHTIQNLYVCSGFL